MDDGIFEEVKEKVPSILIVFFPPMSLIFNFVSKVAQMTYCFFFYKIPQNNPKNDLYFPDNDLLSNDLYCFFKRSNLSTPFNRNFLCSKYFKMIDFSRGAKSTKTTINFYRKFSKK